MARSGATANTRSRGSLRLGKRSQLMNETSGMRVRFGARGLVGREAGHEIFWFSRLFEAPQGFLAEQDLPSVAELRSRWADEEGKVRAFLSDLKDADLDRKVIFRGRDGNDRSLLVWQLLTQVFHHTVQHRSEAAEALTAINRSPGDMDLLVYLNSKASR